MARKDPINALHSRRLAAVDVFSKAANALLETAADYRALQDQALAEAEERQELAAVARAGALDAEAKAAAIRKLLG
jgi:hypothetical protein